MVRFIGRKKVGLIVVTAATTCELPRLLPSSAQQVVVRKTKMDYFNECLCKKLVTEKQRKSCVNGHLTTQMLIQLLGQYDIDRESCKFSILI